MRRPLAAATLLAAAMLAACPPPAGRVAPADGGGAGGGAEGPNTGPLVSTLQVEAGADSVRFVLLVTNADQAPLALEFATAQRYDFAVRDGGREVWRWSAGRGFAQVLGSEALAPGETRTYAERWRPPAGLSGRTLTAVGTLTTRTGRVERTARFVVP